MAAADIHPPMLTDVISNPLFHSMEHFWDKWGVTHGDLNNVLNTWLVMIILIVASVLVKNKLEMIPRGSQNFWEVVVKSTQYFTRAPVLSTTSTLTRIEWFPLRDNTKGVPTFPAVPTNTFEALK